MDISMRRFISSEGERAAVLVDGSGMPLYYPALFATWHLRSRSLAANSIVNALTAIKVLYAWQNDLGIDMESQFSRGELLDEEHVRNLCDFMQRAIPSEKRGANIVSIRRQPKTIGAANHYFRLSVVADYLGFLAARLRPRGQSDGNAKLMVEMIKANRPSKPNRSASDKSEQYLDDAVIDFIAEALKPGSELNPNSPAIKFTTLWHSPKPNPTPPYWRALLLSPCKKNSNILACNVPVLSNRIKS